LLFKEVFGFVLEKTIFALKIIRRCDVNGKEKEEDFSSEKVISNSPSI